MALPAHKYKAFFDFAGGQNDTVSEVIVSPRDSSELLNVDLERDGAVSSRRGAILLDSAGGGEGGLLEQFFPTLGTPVLIGAFGTKLRTWNGSSWDDLLTGLANNLIVLGVAFKDLVFFQNNSDVPIVYWQAAPSTPRAYRAGVPPAPATAPTDGGSVAGNLVAGNKYLVRVRFASIFDNTEFGEPSAATEITVGAGGGNTINIPVYTPGAGIEYRVGARILERTTAGATPGGVFFQESVVPNNTATTTTIVGVAGGAPDANLVQPMPVVGMRRTMPKLFPFIEYGNRILGHDPSDPGRIVYSEIDEFGILPGAFPDENEIFLEILDATDLPALLLRLGDFVIAYCGRSTHLLHIDEGGTAYTRRIGHHRLGIPGPRCGVELPIGNLIWTYRGPYLFTGQQPFFIGEKIEGKLEAIAKTDLTQMFVVHRSQERRRQVKFVLPLSGAKNNLAAVYHYRRVTLNPEGWPTQHAWSFYDGFEAKSGTLIEDTNSHEDVEYSADYAGNLFREDVGTTDDHLATEGPIAAKHLTAWLDMDEPHLEKQFTDLWVFLGGDSTAVSAAWETTFGAGTAGYATLQLQDDPDAQFDTAVFDTARFAMGQTRIMHAPLALDGEGARGKYIRFQFTGAPGTEAFTVVGFVVKFQSLSDRGGAG